MSVREYSEDEMYSIIGRNIRMYRVENNMSQRELYEALKKPLEERIPGFCLETIEQIEEGNINFLNISTMAIIAYYLGVKPSSLQIDNTYEENLHRSN